jgi:hypothetical protein
MFERLHFACGDFAARDTRRKVRGKVVSSSRCFVKSVAPRWHQIGALVRHIRNRTDVVSACVAQRERDVKELGGKVLMEKQHAHEFVIPFVSAESPAVDDGASSLRFQQCDGTTEKESAGKNML